MYNISINGYRISVSSWKYIWVQWIAFWKTNVFISIKFFISFIFDWYNVLLFDCSNLFWWCLIQWMKVVVDCNQSTSLFNWFQSNSGIAYVVSRRFFFGLTFSFCSRNDIKWTRESSRFFFLDKVMVAV